MKPVKICFISLFAYPLFNPEVRAEFGGAELQLYYLATELAMDPQFDVSFITGDFGQPDIEIREGIKIYKFVEVRRQIKYMSTIWWILKLWFLLKKARSDIYIQRAAGMITGLTALFCKANRKKFIYMLAHDADVEDSKPSWMPGGMAGGITWRLFREGLRLADLVIAQHHAQKENLKRLYGKIGCIRSSAHKLPENSNSSDKEFILWVARCEGWKQPEIFLKLAESFHEEKFVMVCPASRDTEYFKRIKDHARMLSNLQFVDYVPFNAIDEYFMKAKIFINTSNNEGFPNTYIQALKGGTPIISLNVNPDEMLEKYNMGRCARGDHNQLEKYLKGLLNDKELWQVISENAYKYAKNNHDIKEIIKEDKKMIIDIMR